MAGHRARTVRGPSGRPTVGLPLRRAGPASARPARETAGQRARPIRRATTVAHDDRERLSNIAEALDDVRLEIERGVVGQCRRQIARDLIGQLLRRATRRRRDEAAGQPEEQQRLDDITAARSATKPTAIRQYRLCTRRAGA